jgi:hypothetical protein
MRVPFLLLPVLALSWVPEVEGRGQERSRPSSSQIRVFLDCESCFLDFLRTEVAFVDYVRDRVEADVHVLITDIRTASGGREYTVAFMGMGRFADVQRTLTTATAPSDAEDVVRRQLATTLRIGLLDFATRGGVPPELGVQAAAAPVGEQLRVRAVARHDLLVRVDLQQHRQSPVRGVRAEECSYQLPASGFQLFSGRGQLEA